VDPGQFLNNPGTVFLSLLYLFGGIMVLQIIVRLWLMGFILKCKAEDTRMWNTTMRMLPEEAHEPICRKLTEEGLDPKPSSATPVIWIIATVVVIMWLF